jgi:molybdopterin-containing oxidoreductase family membrane subunit
LFFCEIFKEFYTDNSHTISMRYLFFGVHGHAMLRPFIWASLAMSATALVILFVRRLSAKPALFYLACGCVVVGIWIEKGMGLIIPGFIPTPLGDWVEYTPSTAEIAICLGIWALGALIFTVLAKVAIAIEVGDLREERDERPIPLPAKA